MWESETRKMSCVLYEKREGSGWDDAKRKEILRKEKHYLYSFVFWNKNNYILFVIKIIYNIYLINGITLHSDTATCFKSSNTEGTCKRTIHECVVLRPRNCARNNRKKNLQKKSTYNNNSNKRRVVCVRAMGQQISEFYIVCARRTCEVVKN